MVHMDMVLTVQTQVNQIINEKKSTFQISRKTALLLTGLLLLSRTGFCTEFEFRPGISVSQVAIQDEVGSGEVSRDLISEAIPKINVDLATRRINAQGEYSFEQRAYYRNANHLQANQQYRLASSLEFIKDRGFVSLASSSGQRLTSPLDTLSIDSGGYFSGNRSDFQTYTVGVNWNQPLSPLAVGALDANLNQTVSESDFINNTRSQFVRAVLSNGKWFQRSFWNLEAIQTRQAYSTIQNPYTYSALATAGLRLTKQIKISATAGYESNPQVAYSQTNVTSGYVAEGNFNWALHRRLTLNALYGRRSYGETYNFSADWQPTARTVLNASYGKEVFGQTYNLLFSHKFRKASWQLSYTENLTSRNYIEIEQELELLLDDEGLPIISSTTGQPIIGVNYLFLVRDGVFVRKMFAFGGDITGRRNTLSLSVNLERRVFQEQDVEDQSYGGSVSWGLRLGNRGSLDTLANVQHGGYGGMTRTDDVYQGQVSYTHKLFKAMSARIEYNYLMRNSNVSEADQQQHLVRAQLSTEW